MNKQLLDIHRVLSYLKDNNPSLVGHGQLGTSDIHRSWRDFVSQWTAAGKPKLYFVKTDIVNCYDSVCQQKLYNILENILSEVFITLLILVNMFCVCLTVPILR